MSDDARRDRAGRAPRRRRRRPVDVSERTAAPQVELPCVDSGEAVDDSFVSGEMQVRAYGPAMGAPR